MNLTVETYILILLIAGVVCLLFGLLLHFRDDNVDLHNSEKTLKESTGWRMTTPSRPEVDDSPSMRKADSSSNTTGHIQLGNEPTSLRHFDRPNDKIDVKSNKLNLTFLKKDVYLYFDHNMNNVYTGETSTSEITEISHIKRVGLGSLTYDGSSFKFTHNNQMQIFTINELNYIALYPNCVVIVSQEEVPTALFFMNETKAIRELLNVV